MNRDLAMKVADAVLYEGYLLYPYRTSSLKNRQRWSFGVLYPPDYEEVRNGTERSNMHSECLLRAHANCKLQINLRFLQSTGETHGGSLEISADASSRNRSETLDECVPRSIECELHEHAQTTRSFEFSFQKDDTVSDMVAPCYVQGVIIVRTDKVDEGLLKLTIDVSNETRPASEYADRTSALTGALLSAHLILTVEDAEFVSLLDPPEQFRAHVSACWNIGNFPVLVGTQGERDMMLCSPIILYDYPQIAPESAGDFYDATEIDEMLTLRVITLTDQEKDEMKSAGEHARRLLERTEQSAREQLMRTHGAIRSLRPVSDTSSRKQTGGDDGLEL
jgi:hypothetical protein